MRISRGTALRAAVGLTISIGAIVILVGSVDIGAVGDTLRNAQPAWIAAMLVTSAVDVAARGLRWRVLLAPIGAVPYRRVLGYTYLGYLANNVLPARLGELVRAHALGEGERLSRPTVLGTIVVERIVDTVMVVAIAAGAVLFLNVHGAIATAVVLGLAFVVVLVVGLGVAVSAHRLPGASRVEALTARWPKAVELVARLRDGLAVVRRPSAVVGAVALSAVAWTASAATFMAAGRAIGVDVSIVQAALLSSGVALATIVPSGPGYLGTFELTAVGLASTFGVAREPAFAMALLAHAAILLVTTVGGVVALALLRPGANRIAGAA